MRTFISSSEAREIVCAAGQPLGVEHVPLKKALGRIACEDVVAPYRLPPFASAGMDGFAVRVADLVEAPTSLRVTHTVPAGVVLASEVAPGTCMRIMTGAPVPGGSDAIVPLEWTSEVVSDEVCVERVPKKGAYIRPAGRDVEVGGLLVAGGMLITPPAIGLLAGAGYAQIAVSRQPRIAIIVTGDELHVEADPLPPGMIRDSSGPALVALVMQAGGQATGLHLARDHKESVHAALEKAMGADVILVVGGVSVGDYDVVKEVLAEAGMELIFWRVRQRPGGPLVFGKLHGRLVLGLPGNPVSSFVCFQQYVRPLLNELLGCAKSRPVLHEAILSQPVSKKRGLHHFVRGIATRDAKGTLHVQHTGPQASNLYSSVVQANCLIHLPEQMEDPPRNSRVSIEWLPWAVF